MLLHIATLLCLRTSNLVPAGIALVGRFLISGIAITSGFTIIFDVTIEMFSPTLIVAEILYLKYTQAFVYRIVYENVFFIVILRLTLLY